MSQHPLNELTVRDGLLMRSQNGSVAPYLNTPPIAIEDRQGLSELAANDVFYYFKINRVPDQTWEEIFRHLLEGATASFEFGRLVIRCDPANLESRYNRVKDAIAKTNSAYAAHKAELIVRVKELDEQRRREDKEQARRTKIITDQFNNLKL
jgi:hypothetical protein